MKGMVILNALLLVVCAAIAIGMIPLKWYEALMRGLHLTIGISTPSDKQMRWVMIVWIVSMLAIFDLMALGLVYVF